MLFILAAYSHNYNAIKRASLSREREEIMAACLGIFSWMFSFLLFCSSLIDNVLTFSFFLLCYSCSHPSIIIFDYFSSRVALPCLRCFAKKTTTQKGWSGSCPSWRWQWFQRRRWVEHGERIFVWEKKNLKFPFVFFLLSLARSHPNASQMPRNITLTISGSALCSSSKVIYQSKP